MKAKIKYNDLVGTAVAALEYPELARASDKLDEIGKFFKIDEARFKVIGLSISGLGNRKMNLHCVDKTKSQGNKEHFVSISISLERNPSFFENLYVVLYQNHDNKYSEMEYELEELAYEDAVKNEE